MTLKTLDELEIFKTYKKLIKKEAIKWVKELQREADLASMPKELGRRDSIIEFMKFHNITEEDLK